MRSWRRSLAGTVILGSVGARRPQFVALCITSLLVGFVSVEPVRGQEPDYDARFTWIQPEGGDADGEIIGEVELTLLEPSETGTPDLYGLEVVFVPKDDDGEDVDSGQHIDGIGLSFNETGSITLAIDDTDAYFYTEDAQHGATLTYQGWHDPSEYAYDEGRPNAVTEEIIDIVAGELMPLGRWGYLLQLYEARNSDSSTEPDFEGSAEYDSYDQSFTMRDDGSHASAAEPFTNDRDFDQKRIVWAKFDGDGDGYGFGDGHRITYSFYMGITSESPPPLFVRLVLPYAWLASGYDLGIDPRHRLHPFDPGYPLRYVEVEWKASAPTSGGANLAWPTAYGSASVENVGAIAHGPDGESATLREPSAEMTLFSFGSGMSVESADLAAFLGVSEQTLADAEVVAFEYNGSRGVPVESSEWTFAEGAASVSVSHDFSDPNHTGHIIAGGNISESSYASFFKCGTPGQGGDFAFLLFDLPSDIDHQSDGFSIHVKPYGTGSVATPDLDAVGIIY